MSGGGAATATSNPYPTLTGQVAPRGGDFPLLKSSQVGGDLALPEQAVRSQIAGEILGGDANRLRPGVVTGNEDMLRTEAAQAKSSNPTPAGILLRDKMAEEQRALSSYGEGLIEKTGASKTLINDAQRGDLLNSALYGKDSLRSFLSGEKSKIYAEAAQRQGGNPVKLNDFESQITDPTLDSSLQIAGQPNFLNGVRGLYQQFQTNGFRNRVTGEQIAPNSVGAAMELHKALNGAWTPDNAGYIGDLKRSILNDVSQAGGADLYQKANAIHSAEQTLFNADGIKKVFGDTNPNTGISKGLSSEKIIPAINDLPLDQYAHIRNVFSAMANGRVLGADSIQVPDYLQAAARQSMNELDGSMVRDVWKSGADKIGAWNANSANKVMNSYSDKLKYVDNPEVIEGLHTLNVGGQIMPNMHSYEGAAQQRRRLDQAGLVERSLPSAGAVIGGALPIPGGAWLGGKAGEWAQGKKAVSRQLEQAKQVDAQMEAAAKIGKK